MGKNKTIIMRTALSIAVSAIFITSLSYGQGVAQQGVAQQGASVPTKDQTTLPALTVISADDATLRSQGCDPSVFYSMNNEYMMKRSLARNIELQKLVREQVDNTPPPPGDGGGSCFEKAATSINNAVKTYNSILALLSGNLDPGPLIQAGAKLAMNAACNQVNNYTGKLTSSLNPLTNTANSMLGQVTNYRIGAGGASMSIGQLAGMNGNGTGTVPGQLPLLSGSGIANATGYTGAYNTTQTITNNAATSVSVATQGCSLGNIAGCDPFK
jgi:hypothetical protein